MKRLRGWRFWRRRSRYDPTRPLDKSMAASVAIITAFWTLQHEPEQRTRVFREILDDESCEELVAAFAVISTALLKNLADMREEPPEALLRQLALGIAKGNR